MSRDFRNKSFTLVKNLCFDSTTQHQQTKCKGKSVYFGTACLELTLQSTYVNAAIGESLMYNLLN